MTGVGIDRLLADAREGLTRVQPDELAARQGDGAFVVDVRPSETRIVEGHIPGAVVIDRLVLEWRLDPTCGASMPDGPGLDDEVIVVCNEGYASSLAARDLQRLGFHRATDLVGGFGPTPPPAARCRKTRPTSRRPFRRRQTQTRNRRRTNFPRTPAIQLNTSQPPSWRWVGSATTYGRNVRASVVSLGRDTYEQVRTTPATLAELVTATDAFEGGKSDLGEELLYLEGSD